MALCRGLSVSIRHYVAGLSEPRFTKANIKFACATLQHVNLVDFRQQKKENWLRGRDLNPRPSGYEPDELPGCSTPRSIYADKQGESKLKKS